MTKLTELARVLAKHVKLGDEFKVVDALLNTKTYDALRVSIYDTIGYIKDDVEDVLSEYENVNDVREYNQVLMLLPKLIESFRRGKKIKEEEVNQNDV